MLTLRPFQKPFMRAVYDPAFELVAMSVPRGNGKSTTAADVLRRCLTPDDGLHQQGKEYLLIAGSLDQARLTFRPLRDWLGETDYRWSDGSTRVGVVHLASNTRVRVHALNGKTSMGLVNVPIVVCDEPGAWEINAGQLVFDALETAQGKPDSPLKIIMVGTLAPMASQPGHWYFDLVKAGTVGTNHVTALQGDLETWDQWQTIRKANPLTAVSAEFRKRLLRERDAARDDTRLKARFLSYRLNLPTGDESSVLLDVADWERVCHRTVAPRDGQPIVGLDLGGGRSWSAATALWANGRAETLAVAPGIPTIYEQERRGKQPAGVYQKLMDTGRLTVSEGKRVQAVEDTVQAIVDDFGLPAVIICDRFRVNEVLDVVGDEIPVVDRVTRWSEAAADIRALRRMAKDGPLSVPDDSRPLLAVSLARATVQNDTSGNVRLIKRVRDGAARDDVAAALVLAAGLMEREPPTAETADTWGGLVPI